MNRCLYSGIFKEEICVHFLNACIKITHIYFDELFRRCEDPVKIKECLNMIKHWSPSLFNHEFDNIRREIPNIEDMFKSTFIIFVKQFHERPGCPKLQIRMTMPPASSFIQKFVVLMSTSELLCSGDWNNAACTISLKDVVMDLIREVMHGFIADYVIVQELVPNAPSSAFDDVEACDSASNVASRPPDPPTLGILQARSMTKKRPPSSVASVPKEKRASEEKANSAHLVRPSEERAEDARSLQAQSMFKRRVNSIVGDSGDKRSGISISHIGSLREKLRVKDAAKVATTPPPVATTQLLTPGSPTSQPMASPSPTPLAPPHPSSQPLPTASNAPPPHSPDRSASGKSSQSNVAGSATGKSKGESSEGESSEGESSEGERSGGESSEGESSDVKLEHNSL